MTDHSASDGPITDEAAFGNRLRELLVLAHENDLDVEGGWECRNHDDSVPDWDVTVTELEKHGAQRAPQSDE